MASSHLKMEEFEFQPAQKSFDIPTEAPGYWTTQTKEKRRSTAAKVVEAVLCVGQWLVLTAVRALSRRILPVAKRTVSGEVFAESRPDHVLDAMFAEAARAEEAQRANELAAINLTSKISHPASGKTAGPDQDKVGCYPVKVFYATDRNVISSSGKPLRFGGHRGDRIRYGTCIVTVPDDHRMGTLESRSLWRFEFRSDEAKHVVFQKATEVTKDSFFRELGTDTSRIRSHGLLVFVHGFANSFVDAARRTAQLSVDLGSQWIPIMYAWPSRGKLSLKAYRHDETNVDWTVFHLRQFLLELANQSGAEQINLVAHSMGNKVLTQAIAKLAAELKQPPQVMFNHVVLTAPDIDAGVFARDLVPAVSPMATRLTLYASSADKALIFSKRIHGKYPRAGDSRPEIVVATGMDSIDVSAVDTYFFSVGHAYYGDNRTIITDLYTLFEHGAPPDRRNLLPQPTASPRSWLFRP
jgi:esterase/lipase superfamily enzyme